MARTTITLNVETRSRLRRIAADRGVSMAALIREAIKATIDQQAFVHAWQQLKPETEGARHG